MSVEPGLPRLKALPAEGLLATLGPVYAVDLAQGTRLVLPLDRRHLDSDGLVHPGLCAAFADCTLRVSAARQVADGQRLATVQLSFQLLAPARSGQWLYGEALLLKQAHRLLFLHGELFTDSGSIAAASGVLRMASSR